MRKIVFDPLIDLVVSRVLSFPPPELGRVQYTAVSAHPFRNDDMQHFVIDQEPDYLFRYFFVIEDPADHKEFAAVIVKSQPAVTPGQTPACAHRTDSTFKENPVHLVEYFLQIIIFPGRYIARE